MAPLSARSADNSDLTLRAVLPAAMILIAAAAAGIVMASRWRGLIAVLALSGLVLSLPDTVAECSNRISRGTPRPGAGKRMLAQSPRICGPRLRSLCAAERTRHQRCAVPARRERHGPVNISWALFADRRLVLRPGREMALAFAPLTPDRREAINAQIIRVCAGEGTTDDIAALAKDYGCDVAVLALLRRTALGQGSVRLEPGLSARGISTTGAGGFTACYPEH